MMTPAQRQAPAARIRRHWRRLIALAALWALPTAAQQTVVGGAGNDYQASIAVPWSEPDARIVVFERLDGAFSGDLWSTRSDDGGLSWSAPTLAIGHSGNDRHAALMQTGDFAWVLLHLGNHAGGFRIHRASSVDGQAYLAHGAIDLGWGSGGEINPHLIRDPDGTLTLTYHRLGSAAFLARSSDGGVSWDTLQTQVSPGNAALPRIVRRDSDGLYLLVYQTGSNPVSLWLKTSIDPYDWSAPARAFHHGGNDHDALPVVLADGRFAVLWSRFVNGGFQVHSSSSADGVAWSAPQAHTDTLGRNNVQPHPLPGAAPGTVELYWGAGQTPGDGDYDIVRADGVLVVETLFADGFETSLR